MEKSQPLTQHSTVGHWNRVRVRNIYNFVLFFSFLAQLSCNYIKFIVQHNAFQKLNCVLYCVHVCDRGNDDKD
jgi:hypothetical protein